MITQAFVLGAGLGTRLRPLTDDLPKPLVPIFQKPLITFALDHLAAAGVRSFVINTHHLPQHFESLFASGSYRELPVSLVHEPLLLETGGGIRNAQLQLGNEPFLVYSGDILTDLPLAPLIEEHMRSGNDVTLGLRETGIATNVAFRDGRIVDIGGRYGQEGNFDYANVSVWNPSIFERVPLGKKISFISILAEWIGEGGQIGGAVLDQGRWFNLGSRAEYLAVHQTIIEDKWRPDYVADSEWPIQISHAAVMETGVEVKGFASVSAGCRIGAGAVVEDSILWPGAQISSGARVIRSIVRTGGMVEGAVTDAVV